MAKYLGSFNSGLVLLEMPGRSRDDESDAATRSLVQASNGVMLDVLEKALGLLSHGQPTAQFGGPDTGFIDHKNMQHCHDLANNVPEGIPYLKEQDRVSGRTDQTGVLIYEILI